MALSDKRILEEMEKGDIVISPFDERNLSTSSYDVTLGEFFYRPKKYEWKDEKEFFNIYNEEQTKDYWQPGIAQVAEEYARAHDSTTEKMFGKGIAPDDKIIILKPGEGILAHTQEFIGGKNHITTMMKARSSMGRQGISVALCAGWGDVGYINRWTLEIKNHNQWHSIPLVVGRRIGQLVFFETGPIRGADYTEKGNYQNETDLEKLRNEWKPLDMIPRLWKDRDIKA